ncbi:hypothetical protein M885DRAFT_612864 [Pelagophyceae sp. CCMP2097]|nr:hypothetical protein M885DRAFT_612864 [Pelagophyceae sp. CCMP2097]
MALRQFVKTAPIPGNGSLLLFRTIMRNTTTILTLYDVSMTLPEARSIVRKAFALNKDVKDPRKGPRVIAILQHKGRTELDEAMLQYKTKSQLMSFLEPRDKARRVLDDDVDESDYEDMFYANREEEHQDFKDLDIAGKF